MSQDVTTSLECILGHGYHAGERLSCIQVQMRGQANGIRPEKTRGDREDEGEACEAIMSLGGLQWRV